MGLRQGRERSEELRGGTHVGVITLVTLEKFPEPHTAQSMPVSLWTSAAPMPSSGWLCSPFSANAHDTSAQGKTGQELLFASIREDEQLEKRGLPGDFLTRHGDFTRPRDAHFATLNQLTFPAPRQIVEPRVETHLWSGKNLHDAG